MYNFLRNILFLFDAEKVHYFSMNALGFIFKIPFAKNLFFNKLTQHPALKKTVFGLTFKNPVGLGAGFDKNAKYLDELQAIGFGFVEIGTVTPLAQNGNEKPRLFRLPGDKALINRMGFNNDGVKVIVERLKEWRGKSHASFYDSPLIIGGNIGKNKQTPNEEAWKDYESCFSVLFEWVDYFVVNVSSPNTPGLRDLQQKDALRIILTKLQQLNQQKLKPKPLLLKISPDLNEQELDDVIGLSLKLKLSGIVVANTTTMMENLTSNASQVIKTGEGGVSGSPLKARATKMTRYVAGQTSERLVVIGSGGIFTGDDAIERLHAGAELIQVWTGFIYEGPSIVSAICKRLLPDK
ncbi:MAG: quinone-dependent dihydroorotate dehydrogenase [Ginsengibacter sp.]